MSGVTPFTRPRVVPRGPQEDEDARTRQSVTDRLYRALTGAVHGIAQIPAALKDAFTWEAWKHERILGNGGRVAPMSFHDYVHTAAPEGLGATYDTLRGFISQDVELRAMFDEASRRPDGNPTGANQHTKGTVDNIHGSSEMVSEGVGIQRLREFEPAPAAPPPRPTGTSAQAALRRLEKAVREGNERAAEQQRDVMAGRTSPHRACVILGFRKEPTPLEIAKRAWRKMTEDERDQFRDWVAGN